MFVLELLDNLHHFSPLLIADLTVTREIVDVPAAVITLVFLTPRQPVPILLGERHRAEPIRIPRLLINLAGNQDDDPLKRVSLHNRLPSGGGDRLAHPGGGARHAPETPP